MYKGISRFLSRIKTAASDFSRFLTRSSKLPQSQFRSTTRVNKEPSVKRSFIPPPRNSAPESDGRYTASPYAADFSEETWFPPPFTAEHRLALHIGESHHLSHAFVREAARLIHAMPNVKSATCAEIARYLNQHCKQMPRSGKWDSILVYHFTRHYMEFRPRFHEKPRAIQ